MATIAERVAAGAKFLDERRPGWFWNIDDDRLEMEFCHQCILGQLFRDYAYGLGQLGLSHGVDAGDLGFKKRRMSPRDEYDRLADAWLLEMACRRNS